MRMLPPLTATLIAISVLFAGSSAFVKAEKVLLSDFKGSYKKGAVTFTQAGSVFTGPMSLVFATNKSGNSAVVTAVGSFVASGTTYPVNSTIKLAKGAFSIDSVIFHIFGTMPTPGTGSYARTKRTITFQGVYSVDPTYTFVGNIATTTKGRKQKLKFTYVLSQSGSSDYYAFTFEVSRRVKNI